MWSEEQRNELDKLITSGLGPTEAARQMGVTKGAVTGHLWRISNARRLAQSALPTPTGTVEEPPEPILSVLPEGEVGWPVSLISMGPHHCKWPIRGTGADTAFCGKKRSHGPYCQAHAGSAFGTAQAEAA